MDAVRRDRGPALLEAHCLSLDPTAPTARERLDATLGADLARLLVWALSNEGAAPAERLRAGPVFAA